MYIYIHSVVYAHCLQMIGLYRDPTGKYVFYKTNPTDDYFSDPTSPRPQQAENHMFEVRNSYIVTSATPSALLYIHC